MQSQQELPISNPKKPKVIYFILSFFPYLCSSLLIIYTTCYFVIPKYSNIYTTLTLNTSLVKKQIYQLYTYSLLHADPQHIIINNISILVYCILLESGDGIDIFIFIVQPVVLSVRQVCMRTMRLSSIHILSVIGGAFGVVLEAAAKHTTIKVVGASAGAYGLLAVHASNLVINWYEISFIRKMFSILLLILIFLTDIIVAIVLPSQNTSYSSHISGGITGALAGILFMHNIKHLRWEKVLRTICGIILIMYFTTSWIYIEK